MKPPSDPSHRVRWLYLDMNSFFASVEQEMDPSLRGKPVAVVPVQTDTTSCIAVSYEGKAFGIKTGTNVGEAKKLCPQMVFIEGDHGNYIRYHNRIVEAVDTCLPIDSVCSIDEIACRLSGSQEHPAAAEAMALKIKATIKEKVGSSLRCSIGVAPNRYLAKIAADMQKPDGFTIIHPVDLPEILFKLKLRDLTGVGPKTELRLHEHKIFSMEQLCALDPKEMQRVWGSVNGSEMWHLLRGEDQEEVSQEQKTLSQSHILPPKLRTNEGAEQVLKKLTAKAALRLRKEGFFASGVQIFVGFLGQDAWKARCGVMETQDTGAFLRAVRTLWQHLPSGSPYSVGVVFSGLVPEALHSPELFEDPRGRQLVKTLDQLNDKFGKDAVHYGAVHELESLAPLRIAFTRIPDEAE